MRRFCDSKKSGSRSRSSAGDQRRIFQDVYEWAGELRSVDMGKPGSPSSRGRHLFGPTLDEIAERLRSELQLRGLEVNAFSISAGYHLGEINAVHPFREGNGRAQREFMRELPAVAGYQNDYLNTPPRFNELMAFGLRSGNSSRLAALAAVHVGASLHTLTPVGRRIVERNKRLHIMGKTRLRSAETLKEAAKLRTSCSSLLTRA